VGFDLEPSLASVLLVALMTSPFWGLIHWVLVFLFRGPGRGRALARRASGVGVALAFSLVFLNFTGSLDAGFENGAPPCVPGGCPCGPSGGGWCGLGPGGGGQ
jgi:hypothetical protein